VRTRVVVGVLGLGSAIALAVWWWHRAPQAHREVAHPVTGARTGRVRLDVAAFERARAARLARARELAARRAEHRADPPVLPVRLRLGKMLVDGGCVIGPHELCESLTATIADCESGDAATCLAIGQLLADTPPKPLVASAFFLQACASGSREGCERNAQLQASGSDAPSPSCEDDALACAWRGYRDHDPAILDDACAHDVADACLWMISQVGDDLARSREYLERACQLGSSIACAELALRLSASCRPGASAETSVCYPADEAEASRARAIGCAAGWGSGCGG